MPPLHVHQPARRTLVAIRCQIVHLQACLVVLTSPSPDIIRKGMDSLETMTAGKPIEMAESHETHGIIEILERRVIHETPETPKIHPMILGTTGPRTRSSTSEGVTRMIAALTMIEKAAVRSKHRVILIKTGIVRSERVGVVAEPRKVPVNQHPSQRPTQHQHHPLNRR